MDILFILSFVFSCLFAFLSYRYALRRGRDPYIWFFLGFIFGLFGLIALFILPEIKKVKPPSLKPQKYSPILYQEWFYLDTNNEQQQAINFDELKKMWNDGFLESSSYVWTKGMADWKQIKNHDELLDFLH